MLPIAWWPGAGEEREAMNTSLKQIRGALGATVKINEVLGISGKPWLQDALKRMQEAGTLGKRLGLDQNALGLAGGFAERLRPQLDAMRGFKGITGLDKDTLRGFRGIAGFNNDQLKRISGLAGFKAIDPKLFEAAGWTRRLPDPAPWLRGLQEQIGKGLETLKLTLPANWRELTSQEMHDVVELMKTEGVNLAWAPRPEILHQLIAADGHEARSEILLERREEIIADVEQVLGEVKRNDLEAIVAAVFEAIETYRAAIPRLRRPTRQPCSVRFSTAPSATRPSVKLRGSSARKIRCTTSATRSSPSTPSVTRSRGRSTASRTPARGSTAT
jgi:hypothetical protein